ncbi:hypothetical protein FAES_4454 [Fibrella aestuarina BUZ 2]|uniref:Outer membrane protein beta-barrel domain-containing protein n=1 Tax=Fibrella aestuarina BUZ 2 TaxID=1166018 RepID=I0KEA0_9BACT|nr:hypothetical protein [Fibrella aestuarina]CCH02453.1 hypothetical protein FAES_4454 [Fibrella aestuarina BUZ 2]
MKKTVRAIALVATLSATSLAGSAVMAQQRYDDNRNDDRFERRDDRMDDRERELRDRERELRDRDRDMRRNDRRDVDANDVIRERRDFRRRDMQDARYDNDYRERSDRNSGRLYDRNDLSQAYDEGFEDGQRSYKKEERTEHRENYKNFTFGLYAGGNSTRFQGEAIDANGNAQGLAGRLGYQLGFFVRGGGRLYGQIGAEYLTSSSEFYRSGDGQVNGIKDITTNVDQQYLHVPAYVGVKIAQSERGVSGIRLQVGAEFATPLGGNNSVLNLTRSDFNDATLNGLANIGFDAGPLFIDFVYHHGFQNVLRDNTSNSQRRILGVNVGVKF